MNKPLFVELLSAAGDVEHRYRFEQLPIRIGRAYDNDIILDDPFVAAHHAIIEMNQLDELSLRDLGSKNAIKHKHQRDNFFVVDGNTEYQIGHSEVRIRPVDFVVPAEKLDQSDHRWNGWVAACIALVLISITGLFEQWSSDYSAKNISQYLLTLVGLITSGAIWVGLWSLVNRLLSGRTRFGRHALIAACGFLALALWENISSLLAYAFSWEKLDTFTSHPNLLIGSLVIYYHLITLGIKQSERIKYYVGGITLFAAIVILVQNYQSSHYFRDKLYMDATYPPSLRVSSEISLDNLSSNIEELQQVVDEKRKPELEE